MAAVIVTEKLGNVQTWFQTVVDGLHVKERFATVINFAKERPVAATLIGVAVATSLVPVLAFVSFVAAILVVGVITLLVVEGTGVLMGGVLLIVALCGSMITAVVVGVSLLAALVTGRFAWRITTPLRAKIGERLGMSNGCADNVDNASSIPKEKGQYETDQILGFTSDKATKVDTD